MNKIPGRTAARGIHRVYGKNYKKILGLKNRRICEKDIQKIRKFAGILNFGSTKQFHLFF
jgi:hypothetical protein